MSFEVLSALDKENQLCTSTEHMSSGEDRILNFTPGAFFMSHDTALPSGHTGPTPHAIGPIGSSRPGSRVANNGHARDLQMPNHPSQKPCWAEGANGSLSALSNRRESISNDQHGSTFKVVTCSGGSSLSASMWATPSSITSQSQLAPHKQSFANQSLAAGRSIPLVKEPDAIPSVLRQPTHLSAHFDKQIGSPAGRAANPHQSSPEYSLGKLDNTSAYNSPALSFSQTGSAPSTGRSFLCLDGGSNQFRNANLNGFSLNSSDENSPNSLGLRKIDTVYYSPRSFPLDTTLIDETPWPLGPSLGEEAFYSKSNVTKAQHTRLAPLRTRSPSLWNSSDVPRSITLSSPQDVNPPVALASPLAVQPGTNDIIHQLLLRVEQLERKCLQQDQDLLQLKASLTLVGTQSQRSHQSNSSNTANLVNGNTFQSSNHSRGLPSANSALLNNLGNGTITLADSGLGNVGNGVSSAQSTASPLPQQRQDGPNHPVQGLNQGSNGFNQRQAGPLDYNTGRTNSLTQTMPLAYQASNHSTANHGSLAASGQGVVNYRALLAGDTECDFEYFIKRITENNDQQASIFMQQKLKQSAVTNFGGLEKNQPKSGGAVSVTNARKEITRLVIDYSLELMTNRFGNFLVSRAIEHATPQERQSLAERIRGQIVTLAQDTFATHCLQKMIDVDEGAEKPVRHMISQELMKKKETVTHKSAGHVWARLLSIGGSSSGTISLNSDVNKERGNNHYGDGAEKSDALEQSLNQLLKGEWAITAKDEVGSLIVQSVLENWSEAAKADVVEELLIDIYSCAVQQWGNFVILHLIEHSTGEIQKKLFERLTETQLACELSMDNFGAKAIEKVLKVSGMESQIVEDYVKAICEYGHGRPALIEIACHQAGAQVLTLLFTSAPNPIRDLMIQTVRRNGVTMKSSKAGSKIWFLVERTRAWVGH